MQGSSGLIEILFFALVAGGVLFRLYQVLGRKTGAERPEPRPERPVGGRPVLRPVPDAPRPDEDDDGAPRAADGPMAGASGLTAIGQVDDGQAGVAEVNDAVCHRVGFDALSVRSTMT